VHSAGSPFAAAFVDLQAHDLALTPRGRLVLAAHMRSPDKRLACSTQFAS